MKTDRLNVSKKVYDSLQAQYGRPDILTVEFDHREFYGHVLAANDLYIGINSTALDTTKAKGQSFVVPEDCLFSALQVMIDDGSAPQDLTLRIGTSSDLSSYLAEYTGSVIGTPGKWATILGDRSLHLSRETTYYLGLIKSSPTDDFKINLNLVDIYAGGGYCGGGTGWAMTPISSWDLNFRIYGDLT